MIEYLNSASINTLVYFIKIEPLTQRACFFQIKLFLVNLLRKLNNILQQNKWNTIVQSTTRF